jgi:hypothetical protein
MFAVVHVGCRQTVVNQREVLQTLLISARVVRARRTPGVRWWEERRSGGRRGTLLGQMLEPNGVLRSNWNLALLFGGRAVSALEDWLYVSALGILA